MEIKINCHEYENEMDGGKTYLFEGNKIVHKFCGYDNLAEFRKRWREVVTGGSGSVIGIPDFFWDEKSTEESKGYLLLINYYDLDNEFNYIVVKNATVFITCKGQTVDKITAS